MNHEGGVCPCCSEPLLRDGDTRMWVCRRCHLSFEEDLIRSFWQARAATEAPSRLEWTQYRHSFQDSAPGYVCGTCGLSIAIEPLSAEPVCPCCQSTRMKKATLENLPRPDGMLPFCVGREEAVSAFRRFLRHKPLLPRRFALNRQLRQMTGLYIPCWLPECQVDADLAYSATRNVTWREEKFQVTRTDHYMARRTGRLNFGRLGMGASSRLTLCPECTADTYDLSAMVPFDPLRLDGHPAVRGDLDAESAMRRSGERMEARVRSEFRQTAMQYDYAMLRNVHMESREGRLRYVLLPVWQLNCPYRGQNHFFQVNGQTGKVSGDLPVSLHQCIAWTAVLGALFTALLMGLVALCTMGQLGPDSLQNWWNTLRSLCVHWKWFAAGGLAAGLGIVWRMRWMMRREAGIPKKVISPQVGFHMESAQDLLLYSTTSRTRVEADMNRRINKRFHRE